MRPPFQEQLCALFINCYIKPQVLPEFAIISLVIAPQSLKDEAVKLSVKEFGNENTRGDVILIHGTGAKAEMWNPQVKILVDAGFRCIVPDLRGHGDSIEPEEKADISSHINDLLETVADYEIKWPAVFVGHSLGSIISLELAAIRPELVGKILAASMPGKVPQVTVKAFKVFLGKPFLALKDSAVHRSLGWRERVLLDTNHYSLSQVVENFHDADYVSNVPKVTCPVHFAVGRLDPIALCVHSELMHKAIPGSTFKVIEWAAHNCMDSRPAEFNRWFREKMEI